MRVIITGGGTGGHVYPGIAIADKIVKENPENQVLFVGTHKGMESSIVPTAGYPIRYIPASGVSRKSIVKNAKFISDYIKGKREAKVIIREFNPDIVIGTGGYVSGAVVSTAAKLGIKTFLQEQNMIPGLANKSLEKCVEKVFLGFKNAATYFKMPEKHIVTGNPILSSFEEIDKSVCRKKIGLKQKSFVILIFGGSLGAEKINYAAKEIIAQYNKRKDIEIVLITGKRYYEFILEDLEQKLGKSEAPLEKVLGKNIKILEYTTDMQNYMGAADLVIGRSGALTVAELEYLGKPSIFIPSPNVTNNHQYFNAMDMVEKGGAILMGEEEAFKGQLIDKVQEIIENPHIYEEILQYAQKDKGENGADIIFEHISKY